MNELKPINPTEASALLAKKFAAILKDWLTQDQQEDVLFRNSKEQTHAICHTHDYCDPNQAMIDALESFGIELDCQSDEQNALISEAWKIARKEKRKTMEKKKRFTYKGLGMGCWRVLRDGKPFARYTYRTEAQIKDLVAAMNTLAP